VFLNVLPRPSRFLFNDGGYLTLSFIPTLGTMLMGLAPGVGSGVGPRDPIRKFLLAAVAFCAAGLLLHFHGICPSSSASGTPAWTLWSGGVCFFFLLRFRGSRCQETSRNCVSLVVIGINSIAAYVIAELSRNFVGNSLRTSISAGSVELVWVGP